MIRHSSFISHSGEFIYILLLVAGVSLAACLAYYIYAAYREKKRSEYVVSILNRGDIELFLEEIEKDITRAMENNNLRMANMLLVNKSAGLIHSGDFSEAIGFLESVDTEKLLGCFKTLRVNNLLYGLLMAGRLEEARNLYSENSKMLYKKTGYAELDRGLQGTAATYEFYCGGRDKSLELFELNIDRGQKPDIHSANSYYHIGLIRLGEKRYGESLEELEKASLGAGAGFIKKLAEKEIEKLRSGGR